MPIVTEAGFSPVTPIEFMHADDAPARAVEILHETDAERLLPHFDAIEIVRIPFASSHDGRGFSLARRLRDLGYRGRLRAAGQLISDQFRYALTCGFDEVEIDEALATRQPEEHWRITGDRPLTYRDKLVRRHEPEPTPNPHNTYAQTVLDVHHYTDRLFKFSMTRPTEFRFRSGEFAMIGLPGGANPVFRAYSMASPAWDDELEFFSIKVPGGALTERLRDIQPGDHVLLKKKATGTLINDALLPGERLYMFCTGTGIAPFASLIRDPEVYEKYSQVILIHTGRTKAELKYGYEVVGLARHDQLVGEEATRQLVHYATTTREDSERMGRITTLIDNGRLFADLGTPPLDPTTDRVMICGSIAMLKDLKAICEGRGLGEGSNSRPAEFVVERAYVG